MYLHRGIKPRVQGVLIDTSTQGHTTWSTGGGLIDVPTQGHTTQSTGGAHRYIYTRAHNLGHRYTTNLEYTTWSTGGSHWYTYTAQGYTHPGVHGVLRLNPKNLNFLIFLWMIL